MKRHVIRWRMGGNSYGEAILWVAGWTFHLSTGPDGHSFTFGPPSFPVDVRW